MAFVPLLIIEDKISENYKKRKGRRFFYYAYLTLFIWNVSTTWWICNASLGAGIFTVIVNSLLMTIPLVLFRWTRSVAGDLVGYSSFVIYFLAFEYFHLNWDLAWPWLTLGNGFATMPQLVQWYEYTGVFGGSMWILVVNVLLYFIWKKYHEKQSIRRWVLLSAAAIAIPVGFSVARYVKYTPEGVETVVTVVQPNIDPYQKYGSNGTSVTSVQQAEILFKLSSKYADPKTEFLLWPETALPFYSNEAMLNEQIEIVNSRKLLKQFTSMSLITGMDSYGFVKTPTPASLLNKSSNMHYEMYNAALFIQDNNDTLKTYHKSKLVPGVEKLPYPAVFGLLTKSLGEFVGTLGTQSDRTVFVNKKGKAMAPVICYESIFGDFMRGYVKNGAQAIAIVTNDGWWANTEGHRQHLHYARLRAVELRKDIARSANTGISCFINQRGDLSETTQYWTLDVRSSTLLFNTIRTPYLTLGDLIGKIAIYLAPLLLVLSLVLMIRR